ncbi:MAG TPA: C-GCAxxG-C-C family protein [Candidatus Acidoferrales bacterium]|nr:C-GCAxxG-C-C family protein [Candidatus Acidoferrales bacterium]
MSDKIEKAVETFLGGYLCSQAVFSTYGPLYGIDEKQAMKIGTGFGAGMARMQDVCGAVTGAFMVIGAKYGNVDAADRQSVGKTYQDVRKFADRFRELHGTIVCKEILGGIDLNTEGGQKEFKEKNMVKTICAQCVRDAAKILEELD